MKTGGEGRIKEMAGWRRWQGGGDGRMEEMKGWRRWKGGGDERVQGRWQGGGDTEWGGLVEEISFQVYISLLIFDL